MVFPCHNQAVTFLLYFSELNQARIQRIHTSFLVSLVWAPASRLSAETPQAFRLILRNSLLSSIFKLSRVKEILITQMLDTFQN